MILKYQAEMNALSECPPTEANVCEREAFRFVHKEIDDDRNFLCVCKLNPARTLLPSQKCSSLGLSFFVSEQFALNRYKYLAKTNKNIAKSLGAKLAKGVIGQSDGVVSKTNSYGHFDLWEAMGVAFVKKFEIVSDLAS